MAFLLGTLEKILVQLAILGITFCIGKLSKYLTKQNTMIEHLDALSANIHAIKDKLRKNDKITLG